jgi:RNase P/RNase MRP subunit POP5
MWGLIMKAVLRERHRYLAFELITEKKYGKEKEQVRNLERVINAELLHVLGEMGLAKVMPRLLIFNGKIGVLRTTTKGITDLRTAIALVTSFEGNPAHLRSLSTSGTIAALKRKLRI